MTIAGGRSTHAYNRTVHGWLNEHMILTSFMNASDTVLFIVPFLVSSFTAHFSKPRKEHLCTAP